MVFAQIKNNIVMNIVTLDNVFMIPKLLSSYDSVLRIDNMTPQPNVGWVFDNVNWNPPPVNPMPQTAVEIYTALVQQAMAFGQSLTVQFATQNVMAGITQAGQTLPVLDYASNLYTYLSTGSLYVALSEIQTMIADTSTAKTSLAPFITNDILYSYLNQIQGYLGISLTPNPGP